MPKNFAIKTDFTAADKTGRVISGMQSRIMKFAARASMALRKIDRVTGRISQGLGRAMKWGAVAGGAALYGVFRVVNQTAEAMDALAKKTRAINFPIEQFQEFRFAAEQSGVKAELFDKSLTKFTKTVGELKGGYGAMYTALKKTNPALLKQLKNTEDVSAAFDLYLGAMRNTPGAMNKAALATAAFGRSGVDMINMANLSATELEKLRAQMRQNGIVTAEQAAKAEAYNDMMNRMGLTVKGFTVDVISPLLPKLTEMADKIRQWMVENRGLIKQKIDKFLKNLPGYIEKFKRGMADVVPLLKKAVGFLGKVARFVSSVDWGTWGPRIAKVIMALGALQVAIKASRVAIGAIGLASKLNFGILKTQIGKSTVAAKGLNGVLGKIGLVGGAFALGWGGGTIFYDNVIDPLMKAHFEADELSKKLDRLMGKDPSKTSSYEYEKGVKTAEKLARTEGKLAMAAQAAAMPMAGAAYAMAPKLGMRAQADIAEKEKKFRSALTGARHRELYAPTAAQMSGPSVWNVQTSTVERSELKVSLEDNTGGKAKVEKKGSWGRGLNLVHTGAVP
jgi:hypothetical protein